MLFDQYLAIDRLSDTKVLPSSSSRTGNFPKGVLVLSYVIRSLSFLSAGSRTTVRYSTSISALTHFTKQANSSEPVFSS